MPNCKCGRPLEPDEKLCPHCMSKSKRIMGFLVLIVIVALTTLSAIQYTESHQEEQVRLFTEMVCSAANHGYSYSDKPYDIMLDLVTATVIDPNHLSVIRSAASIGYFYNKNGFSAESLNVRIKEIITSGGFTQYWYFINDGEFDQTSESSSNTIAI